MIAHRKIPYESIQFQYLIDIPHCHCLYGSARESDTGLSVLFLVFSQEKKIYRRNGLKETWVELDNPQEHAHIRRHLLRAMEDSVPLYTLNENIVSLDRNFSL